MKPTIFLAFIFLAITATAQDDLSGYLSTHRYSFTLDKGFGGPLADTLQTRLAGYRLMLEAEGGSHELRLYEQLELDWLRFLHERMGVTHFIAEAGTSHAVLVNKYMATGDKTIYPFRKTGFFDALLHYNQTLPADQRLIMTGVDFERGSTYVRGLKALLRGEDARAADIHERVRTRRAVAKQAQRSSRASSSGWVAGAASMPEAIRAAVALIRDAPDSGYDCDGTLRMNDQLKKALAGNEPAFREYFGGAFADFEKIVRNNGTCNDALRNRNGHMAENFMTFDREVKAPVYYGEFGEAHTILKNRNLASIINNVEAFRGKVAVINLYCYGCSVPPESSIPNWPPKGVNPEGVSNWPLHDIEKNILRYFLPLCEGDFTLFDFSGDSPVAAKYRAYGQFLIVAKGQH
jgi:hypothetical protein